jgi:hypothetical protein
MMRKIIAHIRSLRANKGSAATGGVLRDEDLARLATLGIYPDRLAGRLRLVLTIGCYRDFRFTRDILSTGDCGDQIDLAIAALIALGAQCDCQVFKAVGQLPRSILWHHPITP